MSTRSILLGLTLAAAAALALPASASAAEGYARSSGSLRAGAGTDYPRVASVNAGEGMQVYGCTRSYRWCDVSVGGDRGWFAGSNIEYVNDGRRVRLAPGAAIVGLAIVGFSMSNYWGSYYSDRPFYRENRWWRSHGHRPPLAVGADHGNRPNAIGGSGHVGPRPTPHVATPPVRVRNHTTTTPRAVRNPTVRQNSVGGSNRAVRQNSVGGGNRAVRPSGVGRSGGSSSGGSVGSGGAIRPSGGADK